MNDLSEARRLRLSLVPNAHRAEWAALNTLSLTIGAILFEVLAIVAAAVATGVVYHIFVYGSSGVLEKFLSVGTLTALLYTVPFIFRDEYRIQSIIGKKRTVASAFMVWNYAFLCLAIIGFLTKSTDVFSRGWLVLFYFGGLATVVSVLLFLRGALNRAAAAGLVARRRLALLGDAEQIESMHETLRNNCQEVEVVDAVSLPADLQPGSELEAELNRAVVNARRYAVDDVVVLVDWRRPEQIEAIVDAFAVVPVGLHLGASELMARFSDAKVVRFGSAAALSLSAAPLAPLQAFTKRTFDIVMASLGLIILSPLFLAIAILIKWDSQGPIFFRQRRTGFNLEEFKIWKFRTMTTLDDGDVVKQAQKNDVRVTRVGRYLRRLNFDELPQLFNVIAGDMSLVGPRPHAVAHDRHYEKRIGVYVRRLKVRPGITGWAQVNGLRGVTDTEGQMRDRVAYDLHYVDNWSLAFDIYIILLTILSPKAFRNAH